MTVQPIVTPQFLPWVGARYGETHAPPLGSARILVLGESHYGDESCQRESFTRDVVSEWVFHRRDRFFTKVAKLTLGLSTADWLSQDASHEFWNSVLFYNYVQQIVGPGPKYRPTPEMWGSAESSLESVLRQYTPNCIVVLGRELAGALRTTTSLGFAVVSEDGPEPFYALAPDGAQGPILWTWVNHPSSPGFSYAKWQPRVQSLLQSAQGSSPAPAT